jgi:hypothetical protein
MANGTTTSSVTLNAASAGYAVGGAGTVLTTGAGGNGWVSTGAVTGTISTPNANFHNGQGRSIMSIPHGEDKVVVEAQAELEVKGRVKIDGEYLDERLGRIETVLNIPTRDITMENKYPKLKELWAEYNKELAKYKTWDNLKGKE